MFENEEEEVFKRKLGGRIFNLRSPNYSVREFARIANIEQLQLINIEKGRVDIRISTLKKIAKGLGLKPKDLLNF